MMDKDTAKIILGAWMRGEHLDDVKQIQPEEFGEYAEVARQVRSGETNLVKIGKKAGVNLGDIAEMTRDVYETLYQAAMRSIIEANRIRWISEHPDANPEELIRVVEASQRAWMKDPEPIQGLADVITDYYAELDKRKNSETILTGIDDLDEITGGIFPGTLTAVGARPSTGKSAFCLQVAYNVARDGGKVLFFSLEMTNAQNMDRLIMKIASGISQKELRSGDLTQEQWDEIGRVTEIIGKLDGRLTFLQERTLSAIEEIIEREKPDLVVIDQLTQLNEPTMNFSDVRSRFTHMTSQLKRISMQKDTAIWLACQLNRSVTGSRPGMEHLKESGSIEEDSDIVILLSRDEEEEEARAMQGNRVINVQIEKQRGGEINEFQLKFVVTRFGFVPLEDIPPGFYETHGEQEF